MAPQQAHDILDRVAQGQVWRTPKEVSDQQAAVAENYLQGIGFQVERSGLQQAESEQSGGAVAVAEDPSLEELDQDDSLTPPLKEFLFRWQPSLLKRDSWWVSMVPAADYSKSC